MDFLGKLCETDKLVSLGINILINCIFFYLNKRKVDVLEEQNNILMERITNLENSMANLIAFINGQPPPQQPRSLIPQSQSQMSPKSAQPPAMSKSQPPSKTQPPSVMSKTTQPIQTKSVPPPRPPRPTKPVDDKISELDKILQEENEAENNRILQEENNEEENVTEIEVEFNDLGEKGVEESSSESKDSEKKKSQESYMGIDLDEE